MNNDNPINDESSTTDNPNSEWNYFCTALMFYTRLPVPANTPHSPEALNNSRAYLPLVGIIIGSIAVLVYLFNTLFFTNTISVSLAMVATILATGAFHEDGFADSCDGFGGGWNTEQVLGIMKDSRLGSYGAIGLIGLLGIKFLVLTELAIASLSAFVFCSIAAHTVSRLFASLTIDAYDYVQNSDESKIKPVTEKQLSSPDLHASLIITALPLLLLAFYTLIPTLLAVAVAAITAKLFSAYSQKRIQGITGDVLGAIQQLSELAFYLTFIAFL